MALHHPFEAGLLKAEVLHAPGPPHHRAAQVQTREVHSRAKPCSQDETQKTGDCCFLTFIYLTYTKQVKVKNISHNTFSTVKFKHFYTFSMCLFKLYHLIDEVNSTFIYSTLGGHFFGSNCTIYKGVNSIICKVLRSALY